MQYREFGKSGVKISALGFGCMRFPMDEIDGKWIVNQEQAEEMVKRAFELGVNYYDTALFYLREQGEIALGKALKGFRDKVIVATKVAKDGLDKYGGLRGALETQLKRLDTDYIDFYHFHGANYENLMKTDDEFHWINGALRAKTEGLIKHLSFSFHGEPESLIRNVDTGLFSSVLCQYNVLDRKNEEAIAYAKSKGLGVVVMGPLVGGKIANAPPSWAEEAGLTASSSAEMGLRFVLANPNIDCALSGMTTLDMVEENAKTASNTALLSEEEMANIRKLVVDKEKLADLYCTSCGYCLPCPKGVSIEWVFDAYSTYKVYGALEWAKEEYREMKRRNPKNTAENCVQCGACEKKCPQNIKIMEQLQLAHEALSD